MVSTAAAHATQAEHDRLYIGTRLPCEYVRCALTVYADSLSVPTEHAARRRRGSLVTLVSRHPHDRVSPLGHSSGAVNVNCVFDLCARSGLADHF